MSRIGRMPVEIPDKVTVELKDDMLQVSGPLGSLQQRVPDGVGLNIEGNVATVEPPPVTRASRGYQGLVRALLANMVEGVSKGYQKMLEISGVGYRAELNGRNLGLTLGYSHNITLPLPDGIEAEVDKQQTKVTIKGIDKQLVGRVAAQIRAYKLAEPYKGKGVKYADETIRRKAGKVGAK